MSVTRRVLVVTTANDPEMAMNHLCASTPEDAEVRVIPPAAKIARLDGLRLAAWVRRTLRPSLTNVEISPPNLIRVPNRTAVLALYCRLA